jgi:hypothetical protein
MKASDVEIGGRYTAKISGKVTVVRILEQRVRYDAFRGRERTTWVAVNEATGRRVDIRSAQRLRSRVE